MGVSIESVKGKKLFQVSAPGVFVRQYTVLIKIYKHQIHTKDGDSEITTHHTDETLKWDFTNA